MLEVIIALSLAILLGNILAHKIRITPAIMLIFMGLVLALIPVHAMHEVRGRAAPARDSRNLPARDAVLGDPKHLLA